VLPTNVIVQVILSVEAMLSEFGKTP